MNALSTPTVHRRPAVRCVTVRVMFGLSIFAATGAGAGSAGFAQAATPERPVAITASR